MRCLAMVAFFAICSFGFAQMPVGFPTMPHTGNPSVDAENYDQAKQQWFANNPTTLSGNSNIAPVVTPSEADNVAYEEQKTIAAYAQAVPVSVQAEMQIRALRADFDAHSSEWSTSNVRVYQAHIDAFTMARGQTIVSVPAAEYATFFAELKALVDANTALFNITQ